MVGHLNDFRYLNPFRYSHNPFILNPEHTSFPFSDLFHSLFLMLLFHIEYGLVCCGVLGVVVYSTVIHLNAHRAEEVVYLSSSP